MTITELVEYMIDNSDGPVTFSIAGTRVSISLDEPKVESIPRPVSTLWASGPEKSKRRKTGVNMREVVERTVRRDNNLGADWISGKELIMQRGLSSSGPVTDVLKRAKIPHKVFYCAAGRGAKMAFVNRKDLNV